MYIMNVFLTWSLTIYKNMSLSFHGSAKTQYLDIFLPI